MGKYILLFTLIPLVEFYLLTVLGDAIGFWNTVAVVIGTGVLGGWLAKLEGRRAWAKWRGALAEGRVPEEGVVGGALLLVGGVLLITPGVLTDFVGFMLLLPPTRKWIGDRFVRPWVDKKLKGGAAKWTSQVHGPMDGFDVGDVVGKYGVDPGDGQPHVRVVKAYTWHSAGGRRGPSPFDLLPESLESGRGDVIDVDFEVKKVDD